MHELCTAVPIVKGSVFDKTKFVETELGETANNQTQTVWSSDRPTFLNEREYGGYRQGSKLVWLSLAANFIVK